VESPRKSPREKKPTKPEGSPPGSADPELDPELARDSVAAPEEVEALDSDFEELFGDGAENVIVELIRVEPRFFAGQRVGGFLCHLAPGSTKETIRELYGGGAFRLVKKGAGGKIAAQRSIMIAGNPYLPPVPARDLARDPNAEPDPQRSPLAPVQTAAGIPIGIGNQEFLAMAQQLALVRSMFPDINAELMKAVIQRPAAQSPDLVGLAGQIIGLVNQFRELAPPAAAEGSGGAGWLDIMREALQAFGSYLKIQAQNRPAPVPDFPRVAPGKAAELPAVERPALSMASVVPAPAPVPAAPESEAPKMSVQEFVNQAVMIICNGFLLRSKSPAEIVQALNASIPLPLPARAALLESQRSAFLNYCEINLADDFAEQPDLAASFRPFFDQVFDGYLGKGAP